VALQIIDETQAVIYSMDLPPTDPNYNPLKIVKNSAVTDDLIIKLYLHNDSTVTQYKNIVLTPVPDTKIGPSSTDGWTMKLASGVTVGDPPTENDWNSIVPAASITFDDPVYQSGPDYIFPANTSYYFPFYMRLHIPAGTPVQVTRGITIQLDFVVV